MGMFATGVTVLTTRDAEGRPYGLTANAVTSLSLDPPLLIICIDKKAETHPHFFDSRCFVVNILAEDQAELSTHFAKSGGDKFGGPALQHEPGRRARCSRARSRTSSAGSSRRTRAAIT